MTAHTSLHQLSVEQTRLRQFEATNDCEQSRHATCATAAHIKRVSGALVTTSGAALAVEGTAEGRSAPAATSRDARGAVLAGGVLVVALIAGNAAREAALTPGAVHL